MGGSICIRPHQTIKREKVRWLTFQHCTRRTKTLTITSLAECFITASQISLEKIWLNDIDFYLPRRRSRF
uniref:Uncharacterized protein n=1 Tax=Arundo donax TaxID=35708 RepID=A0A0A9NMU4_ARUDO